MLTGEKKRPMTTVLRELLARPGIVRAPGAYDPISARLVEQAGFEAVYMTGAGTAMALPGLPDYGVRTPDEIVTSARNMAMAIDVPLIVDGDTGFGGILNAMRLIRDYERAGVAGVHLEDQELPKRCGHLPGKRLVPVEEHVARIRAACDARTDKDFVIIARIDALTVTGFDDAVRRGKAYRDAGADLLFFDGIPDRRTLEALPKALPGVPLLANMLDGGLTPLLPARELEALGYKLVIWPFATLGPAIRAMKEVLAQLKAKDDTAPMSDRIAGKDEIFELFSFADAEALVAKYSSEKNS